AFLQDQVLGSRALDARSDLGALLRRANILVSSFREASDSLENYNQQLLRTPSIRPVARDLSWVTSQFNPSRRHPIYHTIREHPGIDIAADPNTPIVAPADGTVIDAGWQVGYGNGVRIDHGNGIVTYFAHASQILVRQGQRVSRNDPIALVGSTGTSTGPHLHYEVEVDGVNVDPRQFILPEDIVVD
ncbi:MAG: M23 family metallopeptidase, partial [Gemmatimonadales bacterium]